MVSGVWHYNCNTMLAPLRNVDDVAYHIFLLANSRLRALSSFGSLRRLAGWKHTEARADAVF